MSTVLLIDGIWAVVEIYHFIQHTRTSISDEIDVICKRTQHFIEGKSYTATNTLLYTDAAFGFTTVAFTLAFSEDVLKPMVNIIKKNIKFYFFNRANNTKYQ